MHLPQEQTFFDSGHLEAAELNGIQVIRDRKGVWRYAHNWVPVPGARDITLTERFQPKFIVNAESEVERVVIEGAAIEAVPELLEWCLEVGTPIRDGGELVEVLVPYDEWKDHDRIPGQLISPEHHGTQAEREVAEAERHFREAEQRLEKAAEERADVLRRWSEDMTRQEAREITGLSVGRVQQLIRAERLSLVEQEVLSLFEMGPVQTFSEVEARIETKDLNLDPDLVRRVGLELEGKKLLFFDPSVGLHITKEGTEALYSSLVDKDEG
jgi:hypothetical protein